VNKKIFLIVISLCILCSNSFVFAEESTTPEWLTRINFGASGGDDRKPTVYFETVQPLKQDVDKQDTFFIHPRYSFKDKDSTYNLGFGYRKLLEDNSILLGGNTYFDFADNNKHYRVGLGIEAFFNLIEFRGNSYIGLSPVRVVEETRTSKVYEEAVDGFDWELGVPVPYMNWIKFFAGGEWYNYQEFNNKEGWHIRTQIKPFKFHTIDVIFYDDNKGDTSWRFDTRITIPFGPGDDTRFCNIGISKEAYPEKVDHSDKVLERVEREYEIEVEKWRETGGIAVSIGRGT